MFSRSITPEVEIRLSIPQYADEIFALTESNKTFLGQWLAWLKASRSVDSTREFLQQQLHRFAQVEALHVTIFVDQQIAGVAGFNQIDQVNGIGSIGYWLAQDYNGRGIMTGVVADLITIARAPLGLQKVDIRCATNNQKSRAIPERLGFTHEGTLRRAEKVNDHWLDHEVYGLLLNPTKESKSATTP